MSKTLDDLKREYYLIQAPGALMSDSLADLEYKFFSAATTGRSTVWTLTNAATPGPGEVKVTAAAQDRTVLFSKTDAFGISRNMAFLLPGDNITVYRDPATQPLTDFARYYVNAAVVDNGTYYTVLATRLDTGASPIPAVGTRLRFVIDPAAVRP